MPAALKLVIAVAIFVVPLLGAVWLLVRWENSRKRKHIERVASELGLQPGPSVANAMFSFPSLVGTVGGHAVWVGTVSGKRRGSAKRYLLLQVVVGRQPADATDVVGPHLLDAPSAEIDYSALERSLQGSEIQRDLAEAKAGVLDGGDLLLTPEACVRTFASPSVTSAGWARKVIASARVMSAYVGTTATQ